MKRIFLIIVICTTLSGCASMQARKSLSAEEVEQEVKFLQAPGGQLPTGTTVTPLSNSYPAVVVTSGGGHAVVMPPCGNLSVVVNPDGSHSTAVINGNTATIVTP